MIDKNRFKQSVVATLAKRAANRCSNPDCGAITSGPSTEPSSAINVGEAAHIYGANPGSARFDPQMTSADRIAISNAIWLCGNCHKLVDDDPIRFPSGLLFEWQREHERRIVEQIGKAGAEIRTRYEKRHLEEFGRLSYLAERLIIEKEVLWEYHLTAEVLRFEMTPILKRWDALKRGLYMKKSTLLSRDEFAFWMQTKSDEILSISHAFSQLINGEFDKAWGEKGVPGSDTEIVTTCRLFSELCQSALEWEESIRFVTTDDIFAEIMSLYIGTAGRIIDEAAKLPTFLSETFAETPTSGTYALHLVLTLPDNWCENLEAAFARASRAIRSNS